VPGSHARPAAHNTSPVCVTQRCERSAAR
jgi:hypothetical protein